MTKQKVDLPDIRFRDVPRNWLHGVHVLARAAWGIAREKLRESAPALRFFAMWLGVPVAAATAAMFAGWSVPRVIALEIVGVVVWTLVFVLPFVVGLEERE